MRNLLLIAALAVSLMACNAATANEPATAPGNAGSGVSSSGPLKMAPQPLPVACVTDGYAGRRVIAAGELPTGDAIDPKKLPPGTRVISPGQPVTMDFSPNRLNLEIDEKRIVIRAKCG